ncbi:MAG: hypothetical protein K5854_00290 [Prevotella sp.]|nr:hypothetical protein [Prevotella sp.]
MNTLTVREFRNNLANSLSRVDAGERVFIRRNQRLYTIVSVEENEVDLVATPELLAKIDAARKEYRDGKVIEVASHDELDEYLASL